MRLPLFITFMALLATSALGQTTTATPATPTGKPREQLQVDAPRAATTTEASTNAIPLKPKEPAVTYSGIVQDVKKSTNRWRMFSLRKKADPKEDSKNVIRDL